MVEARTVVIECPQCHQPVVVRPVIGEPESDGGEVTITVTPEYHHDCEGALVVPESDDRRSSDP